MPFHRKLKEIWFLAYVIFCMKAYQNPWCMSVAGVIGNSILSSLPYSLAFDCISLALYNILSVISPSYELLKHFIFLLYFSTFYSIYQVFIHWASFILCIQPLLPDSILHEGTNYVLFTSISPTPSTECLHMKVGFCYMSEWINYK